MNSMVYRMVSCMCARISSTSKVLLPNQTLSACTTQQNTAYEKTQTDRQTSCLFVPKTPLHHLAPTFLPPGFSNALSSSFSSSFTPPCYFPSIHPHRTNKQPNPHTPIHTYVSPTRTSPLRSPAYNNNHRVLRCPRPPRPRPRHQGLNFYLFIYVAISSIPIPIPFPRPLTKREGEIEGFFSILFFSIYLV